MAVINFPSNPTNGQTVIFGSTKYSYSAAYGTWDLVPNIVRGFEVSTSPPLNPIHGQAWIDTDGITLERPALISRWTFIVGSPTAIFSGQGLEGTSLSYFPSSEQVYLNGISLIRDIDYIAKTGASIDLALATSVGDVVQVITMF